jgi:hypothetical protein
VQKAANRSAPLRGLPVRVSAEAWRVLLTLLTAHANGDAQAADRLRRFSLCQPDAAVRAAMAFFLDLPPEDARHVVAG